MKQQYVSLDKRSKKKQKEFHDTQRKNWGEFNPITRKTTNQKVYNRKKSKKLLFVAQIIDFGVK